MFSNSCAAALRDFPAAFLGDNGADFLSDAFSDTAFAYSVLQVMRPGPRCDPIHYDGGASLLHMGLIILELGLWCATLATAESPG